ncbi:MAG: helix-turn-helix transcriptional regulator [Chloroflexi bacterium]|nr:helix-turn-helix transcriptional regulator [Chloroflexota bacterium]
MGIIAQICAIVKISVELGLERCDMEFSDRLRMLRLELGITRGAIAQMGGMSVSNYNRYEAGVVVPTVPFLTALYRGTGVNLVWLLTGEGRCWGLVAFWSWSWICCAGFGSWGGAAQNVFAD